MAKKPIIKMKRDMREYFAKAGLNLTFERRLTMTPTINTPNIFDIKTPAPPFIIPPILPNYEAVIKARRKIVPKNTMIIPNQVINQTAQSGNLGSRDLTILYKKPNTPITIPMHNGFTHQCSAMVPPFLPTLYSIFENCQGVK